MTVFSFSAPRFTEDDEQTERALLTEEERQHIKHDMKGIPTLHFNETPEMIATGEKEFSDALNGIPSDRKEALEFAEIVCPNLVKRETPAKKFLRCECYNATLAAQRLVKYWEQRRLIFGEKAFLPLTIEQGALSSEDVALLKMGNFSLLPNDEHGRTVLYEARGEVVDQVACQSLSHLSMLRAQWYMIHLAMERESSQTHGVVIISNGRRMLPNHCSRRHEKLLWTAIKECLPIKVKAVHLCFPKSFMELFLPVLKPILGKELRLRYNVHWGSPGDVLVTLKDYGISEEGIPRDLGGRYMEQNDKFLEKRGEIETQQQLPILSVTGKRHRMVTNSPDTGTRFQEGGNMIRATRSSQSMFGYSTPMNKRARLVDNKNPLNPPGASELLLDVKRGQVKGRLFIANMSTPSMLEHKKPAKRQRLDQTFKAVFREDTNCS